MLGTYRQFVHNHQSIHRLPELALLAGSDAQISGEFRKKNSCTDHLIKGSLAQRMKAVTSPVMGATLE